MVVNLIFVNLLLYRDVSRLLVIAISIVIIRRQLIHSLFAHSPLDYKFIFASTLPHYNLQLLLTLTLFILV
jgi:hypothetical protein